MSVRNLELVKEKDELKHTIYHDFVKTINKNSIYKSISLVKINNGTAFYECEPYDSAYRYSNDDQFFETCQKIERVFKSIIRKFSKNIM